MQTEYDEVKSHEHTHPVEREQNRVISVRLFAVIRQIFEELNYRRSYNLNSKHCYYFLNYRNIFALFSVIIYHESNLI